MGFLDDWDEKLTYQFRDTGTPGTLLSVLDVVFYLSEIFGLASRLAPTDVYRDEQSVVVDLKLCQVQNRKLYGRGIYQIPSVHGYTTSAESIHYPKTLPKEDVIGRPRELALEAAKYIFERFGYTPSKQLLASMQGDLQIHS